MTTKLPLSDRPLIRDPDLAAAIEKELAPYSGAKLEKAQNAVREERASGFQGPFSMLVARYRDRIKKAVKD